MSRIKIRKPKPWRNRDREVVHDLTDQDVIHMIKTGKNLPPLKVSPALPRKADKGDKNGSCNREACQRPGAKWFNHSAKRYYCETCAAKHAEGVDTARSITKFYADTRGKAILTYDH